MLVFSQIMKQIVLIGLVELTILYLVKGQDKFPASLEVSPSSPSPGVTLNMTCSFKLLKSEFSDVRVREDKNLIFISNDDWRTKWPKVKDYGQILSETEETMSKAWLTFQPSFCDNKEMEKKYEFQVDEDQLGFSLKKASVTFTGPSLKVFLNNEEICQDGTHTQGSEAVGKEQTFKLVAEHELKEIKALELKVANETFSNFTPNNNDSAICVYGGEVSGKATFPNPGEFLLEYTIQKDSGDPVPKTCKIKIEDTKAQYQTWELAVFIVIPLLVILIVAILLCYFLTGSTRRTFILFVVGALVIFFIIGIILWFTVGKVAAACVVAISFVFIIVGFLIYSYSNLRSGKGIAVPHDL